MLMTSWLDDIDPASLTIGERSCAYLGHVWQQRPAEIPGALHDPRIIDYSAHCRRGGVFTGVDLHGRPLWRGGAPLPLHRDEDPWCAALASDTLLHNLLPDEAPPHGLRVSVRELCEDARSAGTLMAPDGTPLPGWLAIMGRRGESPLNGGRGHVRCVIQHTPSSYLAIGGNESNTVVADWHSLANVLAWIAR